MENVYDTGKGRAWSKDLVEKLTHPVGFLFTSIRKIPIACVAVFYLFIFSFPATQKMGQFQNNFVISSEEVKLNFRQKSFQ